METIVCQHCNKIIGYAESEKMGVLYGTCADKCESEEASILSMINKKWARQGARS